MPPTPPSSHDTDTIDNDNTIDKPIDKASQAFPSPDLAEINRHLHALFPPAFVHAFPDAQIEIAYGMPETGPNRARQFSAHKPEQAAAFAYARSARHQNVYVGVTLRDGQQSGTARAGKSFCLTSPYAWTDFDGANDHDRVKALLAEKNITPALAVFTGTTPHDRFHLYFRLSSATQGQIESVNEALHAWLGGDKVGNADRILRLAGTVNHPSAAKKAKGQTVELVGLDINPEAPAYNAGHLLALGKAAPGGGNGHIEGNPFIAYADSAPRKKGKELDELRTLLQETKHGSWHNNLRTVTASLIAQGWPPAAVAVFCAPFCEQGEDDPDLIELLKKPIEEGWGQAKAPLAPPHVEDIQPQVSIPGQHSKNLLSYAEMVQLPLPRWLIEDVLPEGDTAVLFGESNSFKSFLAIDMACSVACDVSWHGKTVIPGKVIYVASEGAHGVGAKRIPAWMAKHHIPVEARRDIYLRMAPPMLDDQKSLTEFITDIVSIEPVALIVYDVLAGSMKGSEKDTDILAAWVRVVAEIGARKKCTQLFVTHSPYSDASRIRGGTHLWGSFGTRLKASGDKDARTTVLNVERHKDADSAGLKWGFTMTVTDIDEHPGETSLVAVMDEAVTRASAGTNGKARPVVKLTEAARAALKAFRYALAENACIQIKYDDHIPAAADVLTEKLWRLYFEQTAGVADSPRAKEKRFERGLERLLEMELAVKWGDKWWLSHAAGAYQ